MPRLRLALLLGLLAPAAGCHRGQCGRVEKIDDDDTIVGTDALRFRGHVPRNLLFISVDTFRQDHLGAYGSTKGLTPFLDEISAQGVVLRAHQQCSNWTWGSTTCTLAGRTNVELGHLPRLNGPDDVKPPIPQGVPFLAGWLGDAGYRSALITTNSWLSDEWGQTQGYDVESTQVLTKTVIESGIAKTEDALDGADAPWFMHVHYIEPHAAYNPPEDLTVGEDALEPWPEDLRKRKMHYDARDEYAELEPEDQELLEAHLRVLYEGEIRDLDDKIATGWKKLESGCWLDDTLVVIWNDHGEAFWEHGYQTHAFNLTAEENDGFAILWAENLEPGVWTEPTSAIDLVPTILDLFGIDMPPEVTGYPVGTAPPDRAIFADALARTGGVQSITKEGLKLQYHWASGRLRLYDRVSDPTDSTDLYTFTNPDVWRLWDELEPMVDRMAPLVVGGDPAPIKPTEP